MNLFDDQEALDVVNEVYDFPSENNSFKEPLAKAIHFNPPPFNIHFVNPHYVEGYVRGDGTPVSGYFRDGENGTGYFRSNPDKIEASNS